MNRRRFLLTSLAGAVAAPVAAGAQQTMPTIGYLSTRSAAEADYITDAFVRGLRDMGYVGRTNVAIEFRWAELQYDRLPALASDLVRRRVAVIAAVGGARRQGGDIDHSHCVRECWRSGHVWTRLQPEPAT